MKVIRKLFPSEFGSYTVSSNAIFYNNNALYLQPKSGSISFDFGSEATRCVFRIKRVSGNGLIFISSGGKSKEVQVGSMSGQAVSCDIDKGKVQLHRTIRSRGDLLILDVVVYKNKVNWSAEIKKCEEYSNLRIADDELFAEEGGFVRGDVTEIETDPTGSFIRTGSVIRFTKSCRVTGLKFLHQGLAKLSNIVLHGHPHFADEDSELWFKRIRDEGYEKQISSDISFCNTKTKPIYDKVFLSEFDINSNEDLSAFESSKLIITPSVSNYAILKNKFPNKNVIINGRLLPPKTCNTKKQDQVLAFCKNIAQINKVANVWDPAMGKLLIIGAKEPCNVPGVVAIKEVLTLDALVSFMASSLLILDIGLCSHYISSIAELAKGTNSNLLTNNTRYVGYKNGYFIKNDILDQIKRIKPTQFVISNEYSDIFTKCLARFNVN